MSAPRVLIAGGGVAALEALLALRELADESIELTLLTPAEDFVYRPLATGDPFVVTHVRRYPLADIVADQRAALHAAALERVDAASAIAFTTDGATLAFDHLVVAVGARPYPALGRALTFTGPEDVEAVHGLVQDVEGGYVTRLAFVIPSESSWPLPMYELALMTADRARSMFVTDLEIALVTREPRPLAVFGEAASDAVAAQLAELGVRTYVHSDAVERERGALAVVPAGEVPHQPGRRVQHPRQVIDAHVLHPQRVVAAPLLAGPRIAGLPADDQGFIPVDAHGRVARAARVYAAGDATDFPIKQGGLAAQQADAVAEAIAQELGAIASAEPFRPVLRGMLLTGGPPRYMRAEPSNEARSTLSERPLWWPPDKIAGRYIAPYLGAPALDRCGSPREMLPVERPLELKGVSQPYQRFGHFA